MVFLFSQRRKELPVNFIRTSLLSISLVACAASNAAESSRQTQQPFFQASVSPDRAQFIVPMPHRDIWEWHRTDTKDMKREYRIDVSVHNNNEDYLFGLYLFKWPGSTPMRGDLAALVKAGQHSLFVTRPGDRHDQIRDAGIAVKPELDSLIISVQGKQNIERLFSSRPQRVTFTVAVLQEPEISKTAVVAYADR
jgi:hypothetical protein